MEGQRDRTRSRDCLLLNLKLRPKVILPASADRKPSGRSTDLRSASKDNLAAGGDGLVVIWALELQFSSFDNGIGAISVIDQHAQDRNR